MNILVVNDEFPPLGGGAASISRDIAAGMAEAGHNVTVVTMGFPGLPDEEEIRGVKVIRVKCLRKHAHSCMPWEQLTFIISAASYLHRYLRTGRFDVCHAHSIIPSGTIGWWLKRCAGIPYILTAHGSDVEGHDHRKFIAVTHRLVRFFWKRLVSGASAVTAPSNYLIRLMKTHYAGGNYVLIPNGIDTGKYAADREEKERRILLMGRMQKNKGFRTILQAVGRIPAERWGAWHIDILGDGPDRADLEKLADTLQIRNRVTFHGWIDNGTQEHLAFIRKAAVFISASIFENCPMTVIETMASGCYPLLSDIESHRQFFMKVPDPDRYFFPVDTPEALFEKMERILALEPGQIYRKFDLSSYEEKAVAVRYIRMVKEILAGGK